MGQIQPSYNQKLINILETHNTDGLFLENILSHIFCNIYKSVILFCLRRMYCECTVKVFTFLVNLVFTRKEIQKQINYEKNTKETVKTAILVNNISGFLIMHLSHHNANNCSQCLLRNYFWVSNIKKKVFKSRTDQKSKKNVEHSYQRKKNRDNKQLQHIQIRKGGS